MVAAMVYVCYHQHAEYYVVSLSICPFLCTFIYFE